MLTGSAHADHHKVTLLDAVTCSNNPNVQLVRARLDKQGENLWANCIQITSSSGSSLIQSDVPDGEGRIIRVGSSTFAGTPGSNIDLTIPDGLFTSGQVCYHGVVENSHPSGDGCREVDQCVPVTTLECGCDGVPGSGVQLDACGVCGGDGSSCGVVDCAGVPNGTSQLDQCGVCAGDSSSCADCAGVPNGTSLLDQCGVCGGDDSSCADCAGVPNGTAQLDQCGVCAGDDSSCADCAGVPNGTSQLDQCGVCAGDDSSCADCAGVPNGTSQLDQCGVCAGDSSSCADCAGVPNGTSQLDQCGVCAGDSSSCADCAGVPNGSAQLDQCSVCGGDDSSCADCAGVPNGTSQLDQCGVCAGDDSSCADCAGVPNGTRRIGNIRAPPTRDRRPTDRGRPAGRRTRRALEARSWCIDPCCGTLQSSQIKEMFVSVVVGVLMLSACTPGLAQTWEMIGRALCVHG